MMKYDFSAWPALPFVSCQCITFGRPEMLNEAVECFLRQDYPGRKELVIYNDQPGVRYIFDHPEVRIFNLERRVATIGQKRNLCVEACWGEVILPWDDDDIHLPWRISTTIQEMRNRTYFKPTRFWVSTPKRFELERPGGGAPSMAGYAKSLWTEVGGYPEIQSGQDVEFHNLVLKIGLADVRDIKDELVSYIYRWGTGHYHLSAYGRGRQGYDIIGAKAKKSLPPADYIINPGWRKDYSGMVRRALEKKKQLAA